MNHSWYDQFTYLHFASGVLFFFWKMKLQQVVVLHLLFQCVDFLWWKKKFDKKFFFNFLGDNAATIIGWYSAFLVNNMNFENRRIFRKQISRLQLSATKTFLFICFMYFFVIQM